MALVTLRKNARTEMARTRGRAQEDLASVALVSIRLESSSILTLFSSLSAMVHILRHQTLC
jgi:hypothetical protein